MINLLPPEIKRQLMLEKKEKMITIIAITMLVSLVCLALMMLSIYFYMLAKVDTQKFILAEARQTYQTPDFLTYTDVIKKNNVVLGRLSSFYKNGIYFSQALRIIADVNRPYQVYLLDLALARADDKEIKAEVSGFASSREDLLLFQKNLQENNRIQHPSFSPGSWVDSQNITFYLTFGILPQQP